MNRFIGVLLFGLMCMTVARACDICACNMGMQGVGLHQLIHSNILGMSYTSAVYQSKHESGVYDYFRNLSVQGTYIPSSNWKLNAFVPYQWNVRKNQEQKQKASGVGDIQIMGHYIIKKEYGSCKEWKFTLDVGSGLKLPTGKYEADLHAQNLPENFNIGNGHYALIFQPTFALSRSSFGFYAAGNYQYNLEIKDRYRFGNQFGIIGTFFCEIPVKDDLKVTPTAGLQWEYSEKDRYATGYNNSETGGYGLLMPIGLSLRWSDFVLQNAFSFPLKQNYANGGSQLNSRFVCQLHYFF